MCMVNVYVKCLNSKRCEWHLPQCVLDTEPNDESTTLKRDSVAFSVPEDTRVLTREIMFASLQQYTCSQRHEHPAVTLRE